MFPRNENRNEGTFAKTTLLRKPPFCLNLQDGTGNEPALPEPFLGSTTVSHRRVFVLLRAEKPQLEMVLNRVVVDVWKKDVWQFRLFLHFLGQIAVQKMSGKKPESPRHPSSRHPRPSD